MMAQVLAELPSSNRLLRKGMPAAPAHNSAHVGPVQAGPWFHAPTCTLHRALVGQGGPSGPDWLATAAGHCPWSLAWTGACYWYGVGRFMFNSSLSSSVPRVGLGGLAHGGRLAHVRKRAATTTFCYFEYGQRVRREVSAYFFFYRRGFWRAPATKNTGRRRSA